MADGTAIEWTDATWNPVTGCAVVSPGCTNCYAMQLAGTRLRHTPSRSGLTRDTRAGPVWNGAVRLNEQWLDQPLSWRRPRRIFVCAHGDLFAEAVPDAWIDRVLAVMALCPQHTFQVLTKRSARMRRFLTSLDQEPQFDTVRRMATALPKGYPIPKEIVFPLGNVWLGVSAEDQRRADERVPDLLATPAAVRFVSAEPLLGPIDLRQYMWPVCRRWPAEYDSPEEALAAGAGVTCHRQALVVASPRFLDWVIVGGESGPNARPMHPAWARTIRDHCANAGVPFFFKQWGAFRPLTAAERGQACGATLIGDDPYDRDAYVLKVGKKAAGRLLDGVEHGGFPEIREVPLQ